MPGPSLEILLKSCSVFLSRIPFFLSTPQLILDRALAGLGCMIVGRKVGDSDLTVRIAERKAKPEGTRQPFWPSPAQRYCTSDTKRSPINTQLVRANVPLVISAEGIRAQESQELSAK